MPRGVLRNSSSGNFWKTPKESCETVFSFGKVVRFQRATLLTLQSAAIIIQGICRKYSEQLFSIKLRRVQNSKQQQELKIFV